MRPKDFFFFLSLSTRDEGGKKRVRKTNLSLVLDAGLADERSVVDETVFGC